jgi:transposase
VSAFTVGTCLGRTGVSAEERHLAAARSSQLASGSAWAPHMPTFTPVGHLAGLAPGLTAALRSVDARYVLLDGTLAECDRTGDGRADYSGKHRRHGVNLQVVTAPDGTLVSISPALPGRTHDLTAARRQRIIATCVRLGIPVLADRGYQGASASVAVPHRRRPGKDLTVKQKCVNRAHSRLRWPVERAIARIKTWRFLRKARCHPSRMTNRQSHPHPRDSPLNKLSGCLPGRRVAATSSEVSPGCRCRVRGQAPELCRSSVAPHRARE